ncbi:MAG: hypothetical protein WCR72_02615, partial [Bacteroidota bacterium]
MPANSYCRIALTQNALEKRIPFALSGCSEAYRLNIHIHDYTSEKIYFGFGYIIDYYVDTTLYTDVKYQLKDPAGHVVAGYSLQSLPDNPASAGFIETRAKAVSGPDINNTNPAGYKPLLVNPGMNGDYILEFEIPQHTGTEMRILKYFDVTVAKGNVPVAGRLWSKAWQLSSASTTTVDHATFSKFFIYSNDSIVTRFDCNGLAGGVWALYSNEWGCGTTGTWSDRRQSIIGNTSVQPEYKIFLNDPDPPAFPSGHIGELLSFGVLPHECDTVITFSANVSKKGNIEILLDLPPLNPGTVGPEDVQLGYNVSSGNNILLPAWDGKNAFGLPLTNGMHVDARIRFLNGLSNVPLFDVEDNPNGFKVDIQRPMPASGSTRLKLFWDDTRLPAKSSPTSNINSGCIYTGLWPLSGCHDWPTLSGLGNENTINSWWYYSTTDALVIPITLKLGPPSGHISGPGTICAGQVVTFRTRSIPYAQKYIWQLSGPSVSIDIQKDAPDTTFSQLFAAEMSPGQYSVSVFGRNQVCGDGVSTFYNTFLFGDQPPPVSGTSDVCSNSVNSYQVQGSYSYISWSLAKGDIIGSPNDNPVNIRWRTPGNDTIRVLSTLADCGTRLSIMPVRVHPAANAAFSTSTESSSCPGLPLYFSDGSEVESGAIVSRYWDWGDGHSHPGNDTLVSYSYPH